MFGSRIIKRRESKICMFEKILSGRISGELERDKRGGEIKVPREATVETYSPRSNISTSLLPPRPGIRENIHVHPTNSRAGSIQNVIP